MTIPVLVAEQSSFVEVAGWQKREKGAVQGHRQPGFEQTGEENVLILHSSRKP